MNNENLDFCKTDCRHRKSSTVASQLANETPTMLIYVLILIRLKVAKPTVSLFQCRWVVVHGYIYTMTKTFFLIR